MEKCALISDIHGNATALPEVMADIDNRGISTVICLGDLVGKGPQSDEVVDLCRRRCSIVVRGNWDDFISDEKSPISGEHIAWVRKQLGPNRLDYLRTLPACHELTMGGRAIRLFHSSSAGIHHRVHMDSPNDHHVGMFENTEFTGHRIQPDVVGYGDIHVAFLKNLGHRLLFNTGSVGNPLDISQASYVVLEETTNSGGSKSLQVSFLRVPYDVEREVRLAKGSGIPESEQYIQEIRTGKYRGRRA